MQSSTLKPLQCKPSVLIACTLQKPVRRRYVVSIVFHYMDYGHNTAALHSCVVVEHVS